MPVKVQNIFQMFGGGTRKSEMTREPQLTAGEITKLSWARVIETLDNLPEGYKSFFESLLANGEAFPYTVLAPAFETLGYRITEKLLCIVGEDVHVLEKHGKTVTVQSYPLNGISYLETRTVLLDARIKITGLTKQGPPASSLIRFNSVTDYMYTPILRRIRLANVPAKETAQCSGIDLFDQWIKSHYKFMNFARNSLLGGEKVIQAVLQPEIEAIRFKILGIPFYKVVTPTHVIVLTDGELILIREEVVYDRKTKYGGTWDYIPLNKIKELSLHEKDSNLLVLSIHFPDGEPLERLFQVSMKEELDRLLVQFREQSSR